MFTLVKIPKVNFFILIQLFNKYSFYVSHILAFIGGGGLFENQKKCEKP